MNAYIEEHEDGYDIKSDEIDNKDSLIAQRDTREEAEARLQEIELESITGKT